MTRSERSAVRLVKAHATWPFVPCAIMGTPGSESPISRVSGNSNATRYQNPGAISDRCMSLPTMARPSLVRPPATANAFDPGTTASLFASLGASLGASLLTALASCASAAQMMRIASSGFMSRVSPSRSGDERAPLCTPVLYESRRRPVVRRMGNSSVMRSTGPAHDTALNGARRPRSAGFSAQSRPCKYEGSSVSFEGHGH